MTFRRFINLAVVLCTCLGFTGCATTKKILTLDQAARHRNQGYSLLYQLLDDEGDVHLVLVVKSERDVVNTLINDISRSATEWKKELESFQKRDERLQFDLQPLPEIELATRESIETAVGDAILGSRGREFELNLLISQESALRYGTHLAREIAKIESNTTRKKALEAFARRWDELHERVMKLLIK